MSAARNLLIRIRHCIEAIDVNNENYFLELLTHFTTEDIELLEASDEACQLLGKLIRAKMLKAANQFINKFSSSTKLLSEKDDNNLPPLWYAVQQNNVELTYNLLHHHDLWSIVAETNGQRLLHLAAKHPMANKILALLISLQPDLEAFDHNGDTAFHTACKARIIPNIAAFIIASADFNSRNNSGVTPLQLIMQMPESSQLELYRFLHYSSPNKHELVFINHYRNHLAANPHERTPQRLSIFYKLCAQKSLRWLLLAQHEFNAEIPVRATYAALKATRNADKTYTTICGEVDIPEEMLKSMPIYREKMARKFLSPCKPVAIQSLSNKKITDPRQDSVTLIQLIAEVDATIAELNRLPKWDLNTRTFFATALLLLTLASAAIMTLTIFLSVMRYKEAKKYDPFSDEYQYENEDKYWDDVDKYTDLRTAFFGYSIIAVAAGVFGAVGGILVGCETRSRWNRDRLVSPVECQQLMNHVRANLLTNIQELERINVDTLPVTTDKIRSLETAIANLNQEKSVSDVIVILQNLKTNLQDINVGVANTQRSFRLFKAQSLDHVIVEISENERRDAQVEEPDKNELAPSDDFFSVDDENPGMPLLEMERIARR